MKDETLGIGQPVKVVCLMIVNENIVERLLDGNVHAREGDLYLVDVHGAGWFYLNEEQMIIDKSADTIEFIVGMN